MQTAESIVRELRSSVGASILTEVLDRNGHCCMSCHALDGNSVCRDGKSARIVLTLAYLDDNPSNVGKFGDRPNVVALCQRCYAKHHAEQRNRTLQAKRDAARVRELGPPLPGLL